MNKSIFVLLLFGSILLSSCAKKVLVSNSSVTSKKLDIEQLDFNYLETKTKIRYKEDRQKLNGNAQIRIRKDSLIWMSLTSSLGIEVTRSIITPDTVVVMNRMDKEYYTFNFKQLSDYFNFQVDFDLLQSVLLANLPVRLGPEDKISEIPGYTKVNQRSGLLIVDSYVNTENKKLETVVMKEMYSQNQLSLKYSDFSQLNDTLFPALCAISLTYDTPEGPMVTSVDIEYNKVEVSDKPLKFPFSVPEKYVHK